MMLSSRARRGICTLALSFASSRAAAQGVTVRGYVYDSLHSRPLGGAFVAIGSKTAVTDAAGRFAIAEIAPGSYRVTAQHDEVDRLGMSAIGAQARITDGHEPVIIAVPSFGALWRVVCGQRAPGADTGFVFGTVRPSGPKLNAIVSASWIDVIVTGTKISQKLKTMEVSADSLGNFTLCGVPTTTGLTIRALADSLDSGSFDVAPMDKERIVRRDLILRGEGRGTIVGKVIADSGRGPIANADLMLTDLGVGTTTNERGEYSFPSLLPGSHRLYVRKIGYGEIEIPIELGDAQRLERDIVMGRITVLDSVQVKAKWTPREEAMRVFEENRKLGLGTFVTQAELDKANGRSLPQFMVMFPSLKVVQMRDGPEAGKYKATWIGRGPKSIAAGKGCELMVFVDGVQVRNYDLNEFSPSAVAGIEYYRGGAQTPPEYSRMGSGCGVIAIHLRK
jgi:hypothetical protein